MTSTLSTIWENTDGCAVQYKCASELYLMSVLSQLHSIIFDRGISALASFFQPNTIVMLWWKYICVYWGYFIGTFPCITTDRIKLVHKTMSLTCSVSFIFFNDSKQDAATTTAHNNRLIGIWEKQKKLMSTLSTIW